jgi:rRNA maturation RNase YbeY
MSLSINFFTEEISFTLKHKLKVRAWIVDVIKREQKQPGELNFIFCSDIYLLTINRQYLNHDTYTDIITFDNIEDESRISGDIFISVDRVRENAGHLKIPEVSELHRVIIHGVLHLVGYSDKKPDKKKEMTSKEDLYLSLRNF